MKTFFYYLWFAYMYIVLNIRKYLESLKTKVNVKSNSQLKLEFIESKFLESYKNQNMNENIEPIFYDKKQFNEIMKEKNEYEEKWRRNIIMKNVTRENNIRTNIIMFYDAFKSGFTYYCDDNSISYNILNHVAMQYVIAFQCRDFFVDESFLLEKKCELSPFIEKQTKQNVQNKNLVTRNSKVCKEYIFNKNKFIYLGKITNFNMLPNKDTTYSDVYATGFENISYKDYKKNV